VLGGGVAAVLAVFVFGNHSKDKTFPCSGSARCRAASLFAFKPTMAFPGCALKEGPVFPSCVLTNFGRHRQSLTTTRPRRHPAAAAACVQLCENSIPFRKKDLLRIVHASSVPCRAFLQVTPQTMRNDAKPVVLWHRGLGSRCRPGARRRRS
jgi:hypothetical protein